MPYSFLIAVTPPEKLFNEVLGIKESIKKKYGIQYATTHIPHLGLLVNSFASFKDLDEEIKKIVSKIKLFKIEVNGVSYFAKDSVTYGTTIFVKVKKRDNKRRNQPIVLQAVVSLYPILSCQRQG